MKWTIYGLRLKGECEARYIGQTQRQLSDRLFSHFSSARSQQYPTAFSCWLIENSEAVEAFKIGYADSVGEARGIERVVISLCLRLDHRLFNRAHVPAGLRLAEYPDVETRVVSPLGRGEAREGRAPIAPGVRPNFDAMAAAA